MVQTINIKSDGSFELNFGSFSISGSTNDEFLPASLLTKMEAIQGVVNQAGVSELHIEKDTFRTFAHTRKGQDVESHEFGTYVSNEEFTSIMSEESNLNAPSQEEEVTTS